MALTLAPLPVIGKQTVFYVNNEGFDGSFGTIICHVDLPIPFRYTVKLVPWIQVVIGIGFALREICGGTC